MKKILICALVLFSVFVIYLANMDKEVYYLALGDSSKTSIDSYGKMVKGYSYYVKEYLRKKNVLEKYVYNYSNRNQRLTDVINDIKNNKKNKNNTLKNALIKADLVTISINADDIYLKLKNDNLVYSDMYDYIDDLTLDLEKLFGLMRQYCKEDIVFVGYFNPFKYLNNSYIQDIVDYLNKRYKNVCDKYDIGYVVVDDIDQKYLPNKESTNLSMDGYKFVGDKVIQISNKVLFDT